MHLVYICSTDPQTCSVSSQNKRVQLLIYVSALIAASVLFAFVPSVAGLMAGRLLHGIGSSGAWTMAMSLLNDNVTPSRLGRMTGIAQVGYAVSGFSLPVPFPLPWLMLLYFLCADWQLSFSNYGRRYFPELGLACIVLLRYRLG